MTEISNLTKSNQFHICETDDSITIVFSSTMENIDRTCEETTRFLIELFKRFEFHHSNNFKFKEKYLKKELKQEIDYSAKLRSNLFAIQLVMREGLTNAVRHGNCFNAAKIVRCYVKIDKNQMLIVEIEDQGEGFNWKREQTKDIKDLDDDSDHGRGLMIMEQYFSRYWYNERGNKLTLEKHISFSQ
ncbi:MAG: ATP-binding protein [Desulfamplus sp.]|nr:ATP-binding protein [Desulfamplus sp.]